MVHSMNSSVDNYADDNKLYTFDGFKKIDENFSINSDIASQWFYENYIVVSYEKHRSMPWD